MLYGYAYAMLVRINGATTLHFSKPVSTQIVKTVRQYKKINKEQLRCDILKSELFKCNSTNVNELVGLYNNVLTELINNHAPEQVLINNKTNIPGLMMKLRKPKNKSVNSKNSGENQD
jgi:hypothetical protein